MAVLVASIFAVGVVTALVGQTDRASAPPPPPPPQKTQAEIEKEKKRTALIQMAAVGALSLKNSAKDPATFDITKVHLPEDGAVCYEYRAKNSFGAILPGQAILTPKSKLLVKEADGNTFVNAWNSSCTKRGENLTEFIRRSSVLN
ncbi:MAG: hypothetical protein ING75_16980 [Rhodocyclaceae bacterium]|nr:hypothetical protein [Rhodocyclaceae bacterium]